MMKSLSADWMKLFDLWNLPVTSFCKKMNSPPRKRILRLNFFFLNMSKKSFPTFVFECLGKYTKANAIFSVEGKCSSLFIA